MRCIDAVIFDFGGVLTEPVPDVFINPHFDRRLRSIVIGDYGAIDSRHPWHRLERGEIRLSEYNRLVGLLAREMGLTGDSVPTFSPASLASLEPRASMIDLARRLRYLVHR